LAIQALHISEAAASIVRIAMAFYLLRPRRSLEILQIAHWSIASCMFSGDGNVSYPGLFMGAVARASSPCFRNMGKMPMPQTQRMNNPPLLLLALIEATRCATGGRTGAHGVSGFFLDSSCSPKEWDGGAPQSEMLDGSAHFLIGNG
jgi:hypothetical protein